MNTMVKRISVIAAAAVVLAVFINAQADKPKTLISPKDAAALINSDTTLVILDVRTAEEYYSETGHLPKAILIPVQALEERIDALDQYKQRPILVYCRTGHRSTTATEILQRHGFTVRNMDGGITRWNAEQLPVVKEKR